jgi:hypothetical protein
LTIAATAALLFAFSAAGYLGGGETLFAAAMLVTAGGLTFGVATGTVYHGMLYKALGQQVRPPRWWLHPTRHHDLVPKEKRRRVMAWCHAGAAGFLVTLSGCFLLLLWIVLY